MYIIIVILSILYFISILFVLKKDKKGIIIDEHNSIALAFGGVFSILLPFVVIFSFQGYNDKTHIEYYLNMTDFEWVYYYLCIFCVSHIFLYVIKKKLQNRVISEDERSAASDKYIFIIGMLLLSLGGVSDLLYLDAYGGYLNYIEYSGALRSGIILVNNPFSFLIVFRKCIVFSSYIFTGLMVNSKLKKYKLIFIITVIWSFLILFSNKGRVSLIAYFLIIVLIYMSNNKKNYYIKFNTLLKTVLGGILCLIALIIMGNLMSRNGTDNVIRFFTNVFSYVFVNFKLQLDNLDISNMRFGQDLINFPLFLLPSSIWKARMGYVTASDINTIFISGSIKNAANGVYGEMPVDIVSLSYMQFGFVGIFVLPVVYALLFVLCFRVIGKIKNECVRNAFAIYITVDIGILTIVGADPYNFMGKAFAYIVFLLLFYFFRKFKFKM